VNMPTARWTVGKMGSAIITVESVSVRTFGQDSDVLRGNASTTALGVVSALLMDYVFVRLDLLGMTVASESAQSHASMASVIPRLVNAAVHLGTLQKTAQRGSVSDLK